MATAAPKFNYITASYTLPGAYIRRINALARKAQTNRSSIMRQILASHFERIDAASPAPATPAPAALPAAPAPDIAEPAAGSPADGESLTTVIA